MLLCKCIIHVSIIWPLLLLSILRESSLFFRRIHIIFWFFVLSVYGLRLHAQFHFCFTRVPQRSLMPSLSNSTVPRMSFPLMRINTFPSRFLNAHNTSPEEVYATPNGDIMFEPNFSRKNKINVNGNVSLEGNENKSGDLNVTQYHTPKAYCSQISNTSSSSADEYKTPDSTLTKRELFPQDVELRKSCSSSVVDQRVKSMSTIKEHIINRSSGSSAESCEDKNGNYLEANNHKCNGVLRSKSDFEIPRVSPTTVKSGNVFQKIGQKSDSLWAFLTPHLKRKSSSDIGKQSTPNRSSPTNSLFKIPGSPIHKHSLRSLPETRTTSLSSLRSGYSGTDAQQLGVHPVQR